MLVNMQLMLSIIYTASSSMLSFWHFHVFQSFLQQDANKVANACACVCACVNCLDALICKLKILLRLFIMIETHANNR